MLPVSISPAMQDVAGVLYILLAASVTADVLLKKSDVRAALGWIAAAWLSPIFGSILYYVFGINRVSRRALKLRRHVTGSGGAARAALPAALEPEMSLLNGSGEKLAGRPLIGGNQIVLLEGGDAAYPAMLEAIRGSRHCIAMASYIFRNDAAGRDFIDALAQAQARGVQVRVLLDGMGTGYILPTTYYHMKRRGLTAARFLHTWLPWRMPFLNMRNHRKLLVIDGRIAFMGGMNIGAETCASLAAAATRAPVRDTHFRVEGPVVAAVMATFADDWSFTTGETLDDDIWWPQLAAAGAIAARPHRSGPDSDLYKIEMLLGSALAVARRHVRIVTPYFLPDQRLLFAIALAGLRGVRVDIVLPERSDQVLLQWAMRGHLRFFNHIAANIYLSPPPFDHSKLAVVDDEWCLLGSSNWDTRSFRLNFEFDLECYDPEFARRMAAAIDERIGAARRLSQESLLRENIVLRLRNAAARLLMPYL